MTKSTFIIDPPLAIEKASELSRQIFFISDDIEHFELTTDETSIRAVDLRFKKTAADIETRVFDGLRYVIEHDIRQQRVLQSDWLWQYDSEKQHYYEEILADLQAQARVTIPHTGTVAFSEPLISLFHYLDARLRHLAVENFGAIEYQYPTLIASQALEDTGYFEAFPHFLMFVTRLHTDLTVYRDMVQTSLNGGDVHACAHQHFVEAEYCLPPTMCFHTYDQLRDTTQLHNRVVTARGKSFRFESKYERPFERLWDFTIREIVFIGDAGFVADCRKRFMQQTFALLEQLQISGHCALGNDPFFVTPHAASRHFSQHWQRLKYELQANIDAEKTISVASFNLHGMFFGKHFNIRQDNEQPVHTGCIGYGLERLMYVFLCQHGLDPANWPIDRL